MIPVTKFVIYREFSPDVPDPLGEVHTVVPSGTHLAVDHVAHGYLSLIPMRCMIEAQVVQNSPHKHTGAQPCRVAIGFQAKRQNWQDHSFQHNQ